MRIIDDYSEYVAEKENLSERFDYNHKFPENGFSKEFTVFTAFEADVYAGEEIFEGIINFLRQRNENEFKFYCLEPSAESWPEGENKYGIGVFSSDDTDKEYSEFLSYESEKNGDLYVYLDDFALYSDSMDWCIFASRSWEIGIVAFKDEKTKKLFIDSFGEYSDTFYPLAERVQELDEMLHFSVETRQRCAELIQNFKDREGK